MEYRKLPSGVSKIIEKVTKQSRGVCGLLVKNYQTSSIPKQNQYHNLWIYEAILQSA